MIAHLKRLKSKVFLKCSELVDLGWFSYDQNIYICNTLIWKRHWVSSASSSSTEPVHFSAKLWTWMMLKATLFEQFHICIHVIFTENCKYIFICERVLLKVWTLFICLAGESAVLLYVPPGKWLDLS
jgi:hypothetical protein